MIDVSSTFKIYNNLYYHDHGIINKFTTTDATPTTPSELSISLSNNEIVKISIKGFAVETNAANVFEFEYRNIWKRTAGGTSSRLGISSGEGTFVVNSFTNPRPFILFGDPSITNIATVIFNGKNATTIDWYVTYQILNTM